MANTMDVGIWIDLPPRQYMRVLNLARRAGGTVAANTVVYLHDGTPVNFVYEVTGLRSFAAELRHANRLTFDRHEVSVLPLERIIKSKEAVGRDKDKLHILHIRNFLRCQRAANERSGNRRLAQQQ